VGASDGDSIAAGKIRLHPRPEPPMRFLLPLLLPALAVAADRPDVLIADFEGDTYGDWKTTGTAFGTGPARGTLPGQMPVDGFLGKGLVNSFNGGDASTGTLTSPEFTVDRKYMNFLIGGGAHAGRTCINLLVGGKVVRTATGPNDRPGGSEHLDWHTWDVAEFEGKKAVIQIVDNETGGWGHINVDHIVQSDHKQAAKPASREFAVEKRYLHLPVKNGAPKRRVRFEVEGKTVREFEIELADGKPDFLAFADVGPFRGKKLKVTTTLPADSKALDAIVASDDVPDKESLYKEKLRPQFHFTSRRGWLNDPNGLVYDGKSWHLFYQHNPFGWGWGNMHWGHATSPDLVHWTEHGEALYPKAFGDWAFSGSAVMDKDNTSGWGTKDHPPMVLAYTSTARGECIAYSTDSGMTWTEYDKNPVVKHPGRDPKLVWYAPGKHWVMAVYDETGGKRGIAFYTSPDLKTWTYRSKIDDFFECPDLFALTTLKGEESRWVLYGADGKYLLGQFDGKTYTKDSGKHQLWYGNFYAAQTFDNAPTGERIQIGWAQGVTFPGMPFNQQMTIPVKLMLRRTAGELRMWGEPEFHAPRMFEGRDWLFNGRREDLVLTKEPVQLQADLGAGHIEVKVHVFFKDAGQAHVALNVRGLDVVYDGPKAELRCGKVVAPLKPIRDQVSLDLYVDRGSVEVFGNGGQVIVSVAHIVPVKDMTLKVSGRGTLSDVSWDQIRSAWK
jgi:fructan beta-fructosidase